MVDQLTLDLDQVDWPEAQQQLEQGATLITANRRQAQVLLLRYAESQSGAAWARPDIIAWTAWQQRQFADLSTRYISDRSLLEDYQAEWLWQSIIDRDSNSDILLNRSACARAALSAWQLTQSFNLSERDLDAYPSAETTAMLRWSRQYTRRLENLGAIDTAQLSRFLLDELIQGRWQPSENCLLYGFERWQPAQQRLLLAKQKLGSTLYELNLTAQSAALRIVAAGDQTQELIHAARWAGQQIQSIEYNAGNKPITIVVPDLHLRRAEVESVLTAVLHPYWNAFEQVRSDSQHLFDISAASSLADDPVIALAFSWLSLIRGPAPFTVYSRLLRSALPGDDETQSRANLEICLRAQGVEQFRLEDVMQLSGQLQKPWYSPEFQQQLRMLLEARQWFSEKRTSNSWLNNIGQLLAALKWPLADAAEQQSEATDFRLQSSWQQLQDQFVQLTVQDEKISGTQALQWLQHLARNIPVQQARPQALVQVLGLFEALGQRYSAVWVTGMSAASWPAPLQPNPLLPVALQRYYSMPQADAQQELEYAEQITRSLQHIAENVVFSYAVMVDDSAQLPSPLIKNLATDVELLPEVNKYQYWLDCRQQRHLEAYADQQAPGLVSPSTSESDHHSTESFSHGGAALLKAQAQCPFQALAAYRLKATALEAVSPGINALQHGNIVHAVLHSFWQASKPADLTDSADRESRLGKCIQMSLSSHNVLCLRNNNLRQAYADYLQQMLGSWLAIEAGRPGTFRIAALEQTRKVTLGPLKLQLRVDRIDQLEDGSLVVMDYKSGVGNPLNWSDERLSEPQVPLYAVSTRNLGGAVFANLKPGKAGFRGFTLQPGQLSGVAQLGQGRTMLDKNHADWAGLQDYWQQRLMDLASEYYQGRAVAQPYKQACRFCRRQSLCRIDALNSTDQDEFRDD